MFLFAVEKQMLNTVREIDAGCQSHCKAIFSKLDELLKAELAMLFRGAQGVFKFLEHCSSILRVMNERGVQDFVYRRASEAVDEADILWDNEHRAVVVNSMIQLNQRPKGGRIVNVGNVMDTIEQWVFEKQGVEMDEQNVEMSVLSMAPNEPSRIFVKSEKLLRRDR